MIFLNASGRAPKSAAHVTFDNTPLPLSVENGVDGALENVFWVTLESVPMKTCADCGDAQQAVKSHTECADIARGNNCVEGGISDGDGHCVTCLDDNNCDVCQNCSEDQMSCEPVTNALDSRNHICGPSGTEVGCLHNYAPNEVGACTDLAKPICSNGVCDACPEGEVYLQDQLTCGCPDHATCSNGTIRCEAGYFKNESETCSSCPEGTYSAEGATSCMTCGAGTVSSDHATCECYQNATKGADGVCSCKAPFVLGELDTMVAKQYVKTTIVQR